MRSLVEQHRSDASNLAVYELWPLFPVANAGTTGRSGRDPQFDRGWSTPDPRVSLDLRTLAPYPKAKRSQTRAARSETARA